MAENMMNALLYEKMASILDYPTPLLYERLQRCLDLFVHSHDGAVDLLRQFKSFLEQGPISQMKEIYTHTFDLQCSCFPCVGYHPFGENYRREMFMAKLIEWYRLINFSAENEFPDHLGVMLCFLAREDEGEERRELIEECIIPSLEKMIRGFGDGKNPYKFVREALLAVIRGEERENRDLQIPECKLVN